MKYRIIPIPTNVEKIIVDCEPQILSDFVQEFEAEHSEIKLSIKKVV